jgi:hypothetical protein
MNMILILIVLLILSLDSLNCDRKSGNQGKRRNDGPSRNNGEPDRRYSANRCSGKSNSDGSCDLRDKRNRDL